MKVFKSVLVFSIALFFSCETFSSFYDQWQDTNVLQNIITLKEGEEPKISRSNNLDDDFFEILSNNYICIGTTSFNGPDDNIVADIKRQCKINGATLAIYDKSYTDTRSGIYSSGSYVSSYNIRRYDYGVYYFVQRTFIPVFGWRLTDLDNNDRQIFHRNTGAIVYVVIKNSPAFYANIVKNDIIVRINDHIINTIDEY
ncbi:MAG: PDZ domain-containing protein [Treponema sp.]|nr:PDZ domain-containing protein [Treponema sp.]